LGCGCGMVSSVFMKYHHQQQPPQSQQQAPITIQWIATDMDINALDLTYQNNAVLNHLPCQYRFHHHRRNTSSITQTHSQSNSSTIVQKLSWGNDNEINEVLHTIQQQQSPPQQILFDWIVAADIIYPSQNEEILNHLLDTIHRLLCPTKGTVLLSYCHRDPTYEVLLKFLNAATRANFIITAPSKTSTADSKDNKSQLGPHLIYDPILRQQYLPPLLDAQILILQRATTTAVAQIHNDALGQDDCTIFPGLRTKIQNIQIKKQNLLHRQQQQQQQRPTGLLLWNHDDRNSDDEDGTAWDAPPMEDQD
jgi:hypothetical protein